MIKIKNEAEDFDVTSTNTIECELGVDIKSELDIKSETKSEPRIYIQLDYTIANGKLVECILMVCRYLF